MKLKSAYFFSAVNYYLKKIEEIIDIFKKIKCYILDLN